MELRQLRYFLALVEERQFTRAADICGVSQSGLSAAIRALEVDLGARLFERNTRNVEPTIAGRAVIAHARAMLAREAAVRESVAEVTSQIAGPLRVGTEQCLGIDVAPLVERMHRRHPGVGVEFLQDGSHQLVTMLRAGKLDIAFVAAGARGDGLNSRVLGSRPCVLLVGSGHGLAGVETAAWPDLDGLAFVDLQESWALRSQNDATCADRGVARDVRFVVNDVHALLDLVQRGLGVAIVPEHVAEKPQALGLSVVRLPTDAPRWTVSVVTPNSATPASGVLLAMLPGADAGSPAE